MTGAPDNDETRNIVICCDGTSNEVVGNLSNVLKLFRIAVKNDRQRVFYDPGVGTIANATMWGRLAQKARAVFGLATGAGLDDNILDAYRFLAETYRAGDRLYLFGFSRGAYTVRALAGFLQTVGLLHPDQLNLADYALTAYKRANEAHDLSIAWQFGRVSGTRHVPIHFIGAFDTVASVIVPRPDRFYLPMLRTLPYTSRNPSVRIFRHAMAIDERRRMFRLNKWAEGQKFREDPFAHPPVDIDQDIKQVWFAGVHADIGGGYPEAESGLSKFPLIWMVEEAVTAKLRINTAMFQHVAYGHPLPGGKQDYVPPAVDGMLHKSLSGFFWWAQEFIPKRVKWREWRWKRPAILGFYLPAGEPRLIQPGAIIDPSVRSTCPRASPDQCVPRPGSSGFSAVRRAHCRADPPRLTASRSYSRHP
jgi:uncharacterized protein (DUF2235 family)